MKYEQSEQQMSFQGLKNRECTFSSIMLLSSIQKKEHQKRLSIEAFHFEVTVLL